MSNPKTKLAAIQADGRVIDLVESLKPGCRPNFLGIIKTWHPSISRSTIVVAVQQMRGIAPVSKAVGRPPKVALETPSLAQDAPKQLASMPSTGADLETPLAFSRYQIVRRVDRRTSEISFGYYDSKGWDSIEVICGSYSETLREIARLEKSDETMVVGRYCNGLPKTLKNEEPENEPEELEDEDDADNED